MKFSHTTIGILKGNQSFLSGQHRFKSHEKIFTLGFLENIQLKDQWSEIMNAVCNPVLKIIIFKNTELRKDVLQDDIKSFSPFSFHGKLLAFLFQRFNHFEGASDKGLVIVSTGLTARNAEILEAIILEMAHLNNLEPAFLDWIENSNYFCNKTMLTSGPIIKNIIGIR
jgi:tagaturonate reductase